MLKRKTGMVDIVHAVEKDGDTLTKILKEEEAIHVTIVTIILGYLII